MKDYDYHALFYYLLLGPLQGLNGGEGMSLKDLYRPKKDDPKFRFGYQPRPDFRYQYEREKFLVSRPKLVTISGREASIQNSAILLQESNDGNDVILYRKAVDYIFGEHAKEALAELKELLGKFYNLKVEDSSSYSTIDLSKSRNGEEYNVHVV